MPAPLLLTDLRAATMLPGGAAYGLIEEAAIAIEGGHDPLGGGGARSAR